MVTKKPPAKVAPVKRRTPKPKPEQIINVSISEPAPAPKPEAKKVGKKEEKMEKIK